MGRRTRTTGWNPDATEALSKRIRDLRQQQGLTQREAAANLGMSASFLCQLETGKASFTTTWIRRLAGAYGVSPAELFTMLGVEEFDWLRAIRGDDQDPLSNASDEEREELVSYLTYLRLKKRFEEEWASDPVAAPASTATQG